MKTEPHAKAAAIIQMQFMSILPRVDYALFRQIIREKLDRQIERIESEEGLH